MDTVGLAFRLVLSLSVVVGIMWIAARVLRKKVGMGGARRGKGDIILVVARKGVSKNAAVAVVQVGAAMLVIGITEHNVNVLAEADPALAEEIDLTTESASSKRSSRMLLSARKIDIREPSNAWKLMLDSLRDRTVRR